MRAEQLPSWAQNQFKCFKGFIELTIEKNFSLSMDVKEIGDFSDYIEAGIKSEGLDDVFAQSV